MNNMWRRAITGAALTAVTTACLVVVWWVLSYYQPSMIIAPESGVSEINQIGLIFKKMGVNS